MDLGPPFGSRIHEYEPLQLNDSGNLSFRLFMLYPARVHTSPLRGVLQHTALYQPPLDTKKDFEGFSEDFEALSYTWGDQTPVSILYLADNTYLPIASNLDSFLRQRRDVESPIQLWIDAICIDQTNIQERNKQVGIMSLLYTAAPRLAIWLGPEHSDSALAMDQLKTLGSAPPFAKLDFIEKRAMDSIDDLLQRSWWKRVWIIQEVFWGTCGVKTSQAFVYCGNRKLAWPKVVLACARMKVQHDTMRQSFPSVKQALALDELSQISPSDTFANGKDYPEHLLALIAKFRTFQATDPRDKVFALFGLLPNVNRIRNEDQLPDIPVNYANSHEILFAGFAWWSIQRTKSLDILRHCGGREYGMEESGLPSWAPDWTTVQVVTPLPLHNRYVRDQIPWWSLPQKNDDGSIIYRNGNPDFLREVAEDAVKKSVRVVQGTIPEVTLDVMHPQRAQLIREMLERGATREGIPAIFVSLDQGDTMEGSEDDGNGEKIMDYNEKRMQRDFLEPYLKTTKHSPIPYRAAGDTTVTINISSGEFKVTGIIQDRVDEFNEPFVEELELDWTNSTHFMVTVGKCKWMAMQSRSSRKLYRSDTDLVNAFWETMFVGQSAEHMSDCQDWLPVLPESWTVNEPPLTVINPGYLVLAEGSTLLHQICEEDTEFQGSDSKLVLNTHGPVAPGSLEDPCWDQEKRMICQTSFNELANLWSLQPYDLFHRPFGLPSVVPDPYWECRRKWDERARAQSYSARLHSLVGGLGGPTREERRHFRHCLMDKLKKEPSMVPHRLESPELGQYALGRRFFITGDGNFGLGPRYMHKGDLIVVILGSPVPIILREFEDDKYAVIGEAYVHGIMNGEAIDSGKKIEQLCLY